MNIAFLTALRSDYPHPVEYSLKRSMANLAPLYLTAYLQKKGFKGEVKVKQELEDLNDFIPKILGISSVTENVPKAVQMATEAKKRWNCITVLGGAHLTALPQSLPEIFDFGVVGEGEQTFFELSQALQKNPEPKDLSDFLKIPGLVFRHEGKIHRSVPRSNIDPLDQIPFPDRAAFIEHSPFHYLMTSRGCPYTCAFCVIPGTVQGYRMHSPDFVVEEIKNLKKNFPDLRNLRIFDDLYIVHPKRVRQIAEKIRAEGLADEIAFECWGRANLINDEMIKTFKMMNMRYVDFGAESGSSKVLEKIKPASTLQENQAAIDRLSAEGIRPGCSMILGHPQESLQDLEASYEFIDRNYNKLWAIEFNVAIPWPGTELWDLARARGLVHEQMDFSILRECFFFPNYSTELYPYLNEKISPEVFEKALVPFKKLFWKFNERISKIKDGTVVDSQKLVKYR